MYWIIWIYLFEFISSLLQFNFSDGTNTINFWHDSGWTILYVEAKYLANNK